MTARTCPRCGATYDDGGRFCPKDGAALRASPTTGLGPGVLLDGRYEIRRRIGSGGMGVVYLAEDIRLERPCALKVLRTDALGGDAEAVARFYREATNASRISHPHVVAVYNFDETDDGLVYLAAEYVEGESLAHRLDTVSVLSPRPTARITWQIANALDAAHALRIAHRDLKPANIMLTRYGGWRDFVKVVDFGIAKAFGTRSGSTITTSGRWVGTPAYMSPEQWIGAELDHRTDIYSLGLMAVRMLAGGLPLERDAVPASADAILGALPPNDWPDALTGVLRCCLAHDPDDRFQAATDFSSSFVRAVDAWVPPEPGVREPWEARIRLSGRPSDRPSDGSDATFQERPAAAPATGSQPGRRVRATRWGAAVSILVVVTLGVIGLSSLDSGPGAGAGAGSEPSDPVATGPGDRVPAAEAAMDDSAEGPSRGTAPPGEPDASDLPTDSDPAPDLEPVGGPPPGETLPPTSALVERLATLIDLSDPDADSIRAAAELARSLRDGPLSAAERLEVGYRLAEASLYLGETGEACRVLRDIAPAAAASEVYARAVQALLDENCVPDTS